MPTIDEIAAILASGDLDRLVGCEEDECLEAKGPRPYNLALPSGRFELAKDVSAFANANGGFLIVGVQHQRITARNTEQIVGLDLIEPDGFPSDNVSGMIDVLVFPRIEGLVVKWVPSATSREKGVTYVFVPAQSERNKPFLIKQVVIDNDKLKQIVFGIATRTGASAVPLTIEQLRRQVISGRGDVPNRLSSIEGKIDVLLERTHPAPPGPDATLGDRLDDISGDDE